MHDFYVRWGDDVQPYILQLASEHIDTLRLYCKETILRLLTLRRARTAVVCVTARVRRRMMKAKAFHCFEMFGFDFQLRESAKKGRKQEFVLNFVTTPDFEPVDIPPRLRRAEGQAISARPTRKTRPQAIARPRAKTRKPRKEKKRNAQRTTLHGLYRSLLWKHDGAAALASRISAILYKMDRLYHRLSAQIGVVWRRRPRLHLPCHRGNLLRSVSDFERSAPTRAWLEPRLLGESLSLLLFTFVTPEPSIDWSAYPFGRLADQGERIPV